MPPLERQEGLGLPVSVSATTSAPASLVRSLSLNLPRAPPPPAPDPQLKAAVAWLHNLAIFRPGAEYADRRPLPPARADLPLIKIGRNLFEFSDHVIVLGLYLAQLVHQAWALRGAPPDRKSARTVALACINLSAKVNGSRYFAFSSILQQFEGEGREVSRANAFQFELELLTALNFRVLPGLLLSAGEGGAEGRGELAIAAMETWPAEN